MIGTEKLCSALELLGDIPAAVLSGGEIVYSNAAFGETEKKLGRDRLYELIETGKPVLCGKYVYYAEVSDKEDCCAAVITKRLMADNPPDHVKIMNDLSFTIRSSVTAVSSALDDIYTKGHAYGCIPPNVASDFENANRILSSLYGRVLMYDDLKLYDTGSEIYTVSTDLFEIFTDLARDMRKMIKEYSVRISVYGDEGSFAVIRPDTLRILFAAAVREILLMKYRAEYVEIHVFHNDTESGFNITGGTLEGRRTPAKTAHAARRELIPFDTLTGALTESFCEKLGGRYYALRDDLIYHMGITFPRSEGGPKTEQEKTVEYKNRFYSGNYTFSSERCVLADAVKSGKYPGDKQLRI
ncbi:MAG: hypothetical protein ACI4K7_01035 [Oscillospiraceae bacterium]